MIWSPFPNVTLLGMLWLAVLNEMVRPADFNPAPPIPENDSED